MNCLLFSNEKRKNRDKICHLRSALHWQSFCLMACLLISHCLTHSAKAWRLFSDSCGYSLSTSFGGSEAKEAKRVMSELHVTCLWFKRLIGGKDICQLNNYLQFMTLQSQSAYHIFILFIHVCVRGAVCECKFTCAHMQVEIRGELPGVCPLLEPTGA